MNAYEIIESANYDLDHNKITLGEWEKRIEPTKNVKPTVRGEWISCEDDDLKISEYQCSICGYYMDDKTPFCQMCGSDMRKEQPNE